jgi:hypothetical protein
MISTVRNKKLLFPIRLTIAIFTFFVTILHGQTFLYDFHKDSLLKENAKNYLNYKFGADFVNKHLDFVMLSNSGLDVAIYQTKETKRPDGKNTLFVYFKYLKLEIDSQRIIPDKKEILKSIKGEKCNLLIGLDKAKEIATTEGIRKGIKPWGISVVHLASNQIPEWAISSTEGEAPGARSSHGQNINISMVDGTFVRGSWQSME